MHFGLIVGSTAQGGIENQMRLLARGLQEKGHEVTIICSDHPECRFGGKVVAELDFANIPIIKLCVRRGYRYFYFPYGKWAVRRRKIDLLIGNDPANAWVGNILSGGRIPLVTHISGLRFTWNDAVGLWEKSLLEQAIAASHTVISNTQIAIDLADQMKLIPQNTLRRVIHNGVIAPESAAQAQAGRFNVIYVGRLAPIKDPMTLLKAAEIAKKDLPELTVTFVGNGDLYSTLQKYIDDNVLNDFVRLAGFIPQEQIPYCEADLLVNSSVSELSSGSIAEALYRGIPVVASDVGGNPELAAGHDFGGLFPVGDSAALAEKILFFGRKSLEERRQLGNQAREFAESLFALENYVENYLQLGRDILGR